MSINNINLLELPKEVLPNILQHVDTSSLTVCKIFYAIIFPSFVENCRSSFWLKDRLEIIEQHPSLSDQEKIKSVYQGIIKNINNLPDSQEEIKQGIFLIPKAFSIEQLNQLESALEEYELTRLFIVLTRGYPVIGSACEEMRNKLIEKGIDQFPLIIVNRIFAQEIRTWLDQNKEGVAKITTIYLGSIQDFGLTKLPREIGKFTHLQALDLGMNRLTDLPKEIGQLTQLVQLGLAQNQLTNLPETIGQLIQLQSLVINGNSLKNLPRSFKQLTQLTYVNFFGNKLTKENIPEEIRNLPDIWLWG